MKYIPFLSRKDEAPADPVTVGLFLMFFVGIIVLLFSSYTKAVTATITSVGSLYSATYTINGKQYTTSLKSSTNIVGQRTIYVSFLNNGWASVNSSMAGFIAAMVLMSIPVLVIVGIFAYTTFRAYR